MPDVIAIKEHGHAAPCCLRGRWYHTDSRDVQVKLREAGQHNIPAHLLDTAGHGTTAQLTTQHALPPNEHLHRA